MPLAGNLRQFALPDVLRVVESGQRTGSLALARGSLQAAIYFAGGQWLYAERIGSGLSLALQFVRAGLMTQEHFEATTGVPLSQGSTIPDVQLVRLLITTRSITQEQLRHWAINDAATLLSVVLSWPDGVFEFRDGVGVPPGRVSFPLPVGPLLAQAMRSSRAASLTHERAPLSPEAVIDFAETDPAGTAPIQITREHWKLLTQVDGQAPLWSIASALQWPEHVALRLAGELTNAGVVAVVARVAASAPIA